MNKYQSTIFLKFYIFFLKNAFKYFPLINNVYYLFDYIYNFLSFNKEQTTNIILNKKNNKYKIILHIILLDCEFQRHFYKRRKVKIRNIKNAELINRLAVIRLFHNSPEAMSSLCKRIPMPTVKKELKKTTTVTIKLVFKVVSIRTRTMLLSNFACRRFTSESTRLKIA